MSDEPGSETGASSSVAGSRRRWLRALSFRHRIMAQLVLLILFAQAATFLVVSVSTGRSVRAQMESELDVGERVWQRMHESRSRLLLDSVALLAQDFGFKQAVASGDRPTMRSALANHSARVGADAALLFTPDGALLATLTTGSPEHDEAALAPLIALARVRGQATGVVLLDGVPQQIAVVPVMAPAQIAWAAMGSHFGEAIATEYRDTTGLDASIARERASGRIQLLGQVDDPAVKQSLETLEVANLGDDSSIAVDVGADLRQLHAVTVSAPGSPRVMVLLQASLREAMAPYAALRSRILVLSAFAAALALLVAVGLARSISRPVAALASAAARIERGDYSVPLPDAGDDELAQLAAVFNRMQQGIAQREERILHQANHDGLTHLPNRTRARAMLEQAIDAASREGGSCTVLMLDVDRFKEINDTLGHGFGDQVLTEVAKRLRAAVRAQDLVARLGGDEFLVLLHGVGTEQALSRANELAAELRRTLRLPSTGINLDVSMGVAVYPVHADDAEALLRRVDIAMYQAKDRHLGVSLYESGHDELHLRQLTLMADLRRSLERDELRVVFQPKVELATRAVLHAEALLRWTHAQLGSIGPDEFIPLAERSGFVHELSRYVLDQAIRQCSVWQGAGLDLGVAVNLSAMDLMDADLPGYVYACLHRHGVEPSRLILEVTESALMRDVNYAIRVLEGLRAGGVRIAIDDFGTGHSSLAQLRRLPVDELKIDKSFVSRLGCDDEDGVIVRATIDLGHSMGLRVIAEGVEHVRSLDMLRDYRCDMVQGFLFSRPLSSVDFVAWCLNHARETLAAHQD